MAAVRSCDKITLGVDVASLSTELCGSGCGDTKNTGARVKAKVEPPGYHQDRGTQVLCLCVFLNFQ